MATSLLLPPAHQSPAEALQQSRQAPLVLRNSSSTFAAVPFLSQFLETDTAETWKVYQNLFLSCLRTRDDRSARACLDRLRARFGESNEHVMGLQGMYEEAVAENDNGLRKVLAGYESVLEKDPTNMAIAKRKVALLRSLGRSSDAIAALVGLLDSSPTDSEAWSELADLYLEEGLYQQAIFCLQELLLITPNAWNIHARMGEVVFASAQVSSSTKDRETASKVRQAMRYFCRSIELCDDYLRGYYGLKLTSGVLLSFDEKALSGDGSEAASLSEIQRLNQAATAKLAEIVRRSSSREPGWTGYAMSELIAARELLDRDVSRVEK